MQQPFKAIIFDMGGVFIRTKHRNARQELAHQYGMNIEKLTDTVFLSPVSIEAEKGLITRDELLRQLMHLLGEDEKRVQQFVEKFFSGDREDTELVGYARTLRPQYKLGLLSNAFSGTREWMQERFTFLELFDVSYFSAEVGMRKPESQFFQLILDALQVEPSEALFVDDFFENIQGAQRLGIQTVWYRDRDAAFAYLKSLLDISE
ncbi:MAG TPA: HAD family phosphatase [Anaerolineaceae bacterium]|jgi:epoxide hydrolase-like predicted phosphatase|nr:HAD family phosphatase [Anaerolineaceae bacterium]